jgi:hypothetical protein
MSQKPKIVIASIARNVGTTFHHDYNRILAAFSDFEIVNWIIIESNSTDNSKEVLSEFSSVSATLIYKTLESNNYNEIFRTQKLAHARNSYLSEFTKINVHRDIKYLVVCDLNDLNNKINKQAVNSCWKTNDWAAVTANQDGPYYDVWALRHKFWNNYDCWERYEELKKIYSRATLALWDSVYSRMIRIPSDKNWIQVDSAFGGMAIYNTKFIDKCEYLGIKPNGNQVCEHVSFNAGIIENGGLIYINPEFINFRLTDHSKRKKYFKYYNAKYYALNFLKKFI